MFARLLFSILLLLAPLSAQAQSSWTLTNISNQTLNFDTLDPARGTWKTQTIYPHQPVNYTISGSEGKFRIATQNRGYVEYRVRSGGNYSLGWNGDKDVWDLKVVKGAASNASGQSTALASFELLNSSNEKLIFQTLDPARGTWKDQEIYPNERKRYTFSGGVLRGKIQISTPGRGRVEYDTKNGWVYKVLWDSNKGVWDFQTLKRGG